MLEEEASVWRQMVKDREEELHSADDRAMESRFVCGTTWEDAVESVCESGSSSASSPSLSSGPVHCPSGLSSQCPSHMECYASVTCPASGLRSVSKETRLDRFSREEEILISGYDLLQNLSSLVTEPVLLMLNTTSLQGVTYSTRWENILSFGTC